MRGLLFAIVTDPYLLVAVQMLDGITAAVLGVMVPLIVADIARGTGHFNLAQGIVGTAIGIGASISTVLAGYAADAFGSSVAFTGLAAVAAMGLVDDLAGDAGNARKVRRRKPGNGRELNRICALDDNALRYSAP